MSACVQFIDKLLLLQWRTFGVCVSFRKVWRKLLVTVCTR